MTCINSLENESLRSSLGTSIENALIWLDKQLDPEGFWVGMLESNSCIEAEWLMAMHFLGVNDIEKKQRLVQSILNHQRRDGSWEVYYQASEGDVNATVESYAALRTAGVDAGHGALKKARTWILKRDGLSKIRVFTKYWLALIGEWPWEKTVNIPPEIVFFPTWFPFNIYNFASWARATMMPIAVLSARRAKRPLPSGNRLDELFPEDRRAFDYGRLPTRRGWSARLFRHIDKALHAYQRTGVTPGRETAIKTCLEWIIKHQDADGAWGGIQPPWIYSLLALHTEGYPLSHPVVKRSLDALDEHWSYTKNGGLQIQACESPVWDTLLSLMAMQDCGVDYRYSESMQKAVEWILRQQVKAPGDWQVKVKGVAPGGWAFERANLSYPDVDDTAVALIVLAGLRHLHPDPVRLDAAIRLATDWLVAMQCGNGGWAAFDKDCDKKIVTHIPFCDFGEALDPPSVDVTAHVLEAFGRLGMDLRNDVVKRGAAFILAEQEPEGSWFGRWGVNHIYGTGAVLPALSAVGADMNADHILKAADWIAAHQNPDGGWGETCGSYMDKRLCGKGDSTASQTAWALMGLLAVNARSHRDVVQSGVEYLMATQIDGTWDEPQYTGTGFPGYGIGARIDLSPEDAKRLQQSTELSRGFMINYNLYRHYFPLMALGRAFRAVSEVE